MGTFTVEEIENRIRNGEIIYKKALENNTGVQLLAFLRKDILYWRAILAMVKDQHQGMVTDYIFQDKDMQRGCAL